MDRIRECKSCPYCITRTSRQGVQLPDVCILTDRVIDYEVGEPTGASKECILNRLENIEQV